MKLALMLLFALIVISPQFGGADDERAESKASRAKERQAVQAAEHKWLQALFGLDLPTLTSNEDDDFTLISPAVVYTRQQHLMSVKDSLSRGTPPASPVVFDVSNSKVELYGDVAVLTDLITIQDSDSNSGITGGRYWQTEVWKGKGKDWKIVHMHISPLRHGM